MAKYKVIVEFKDLQDKGYYYQPGDSFPRDGKEASQRRLAELSGSTNKLGKPLIVEEPEEVEKPKKASKKTTKKGK